MAPDAHDGDMTTSTTIYDIPRYAAQPTCGLAARYMRSTSTDFTWDHLDLCDHLPYEGCRNCCPDWDRLDYAKVAEQAFEATGGADWGDHTNWWVMFSEGTHRITDFLHTR